MAKRPVAKPAAVAKPAEPSPPIFTNDVPGRQVHLGNGVVLQCGESIELTAELEAALRGSGLIA